MSSKIAYLNLLSITNSFINRNRLLFTPINESNSKLLNMEIKSLNLDLHYEKLNNEILNEHLFQKIQTISIACSNVYDVDHGLFKNNYHLSYIEWSINNIRQFFYTQNKWVGSINFDIISIAAIGFVEEKSELNFYELYDYPEEDFCLFISLQSKNSLYSIIDPGKKINCSCSIIWIM